MWEKLEGGQVWKEEGDEVLLALKLFFLFLSLCFAFCSVSLSTTVYSFSVSRSRTSSSTEGTVVCVSHKYLLCLKGESLCPPSHAGACRG